MSIFDIGSEICILYQTYLEQAKTIIWNGPLGVFENDSFMTGSKNIAEKIISITQNQNVLSLCGCGDTLAMLNKMGMFHDFSYCSTAGGAFLEFLEGKSFPGIMALLSP